jgi:hypothetical protein
MNSENKPNKAAFYKQQMELKQLSPKTIVTCPELQQYF